LSVSPGGRSRQVSKRVGCAGIVVAAAVTLGLSVHHGVQHTAALDRPSNVAADTAAFRQEECLYYAIRSEVPKGATVYVNTGSWQHMQRLAELSTLWAVPQPTLATAQWRLTIVRARGHCAGLALKASRL
jgi:hypothetical protein